MNKNIKITIITVISLLIFLLIVFIISNIIAYNILCPKQDNTVNSGRFYMIKKPFNFKIWKKLRFKGNKNSIKLRPAFGTEYKNPGVILLGCEYMYGERLTPEQTLGAKLSKIMKAPVYNISIPGGGLQHALFQVESSDYDDEIENSKYAVLLITGEHIWRIKTYSNGYYQEPYVWPVFDINKDGILVPHKYTLFERTYIYQYLNKLYWQIFASFDSKFDLVKEHIVKLNQDLKEINSNIIFIVILFADNDHGLKFLTSPRWYELQEQGINVIDADELSLRNNISISDQKYRIEGDGHPSEKVWDVLAPEIAKELNK